MEVGKSSKNFNWFLFLMNSKPIQDQDLCAVGGKRLWSWFLSKTLKLLEKVEDRSDLKDVEKALADPETNKKHRKNMGSKLNYSVPSEEKH
jgi:hypothetical protein